MATLTENQELRRDSLGKVLNIRESQRNDGTYSYRWSENGVRKQIYANSLLELRQKEYEIFKDLDMVRSVEMNTLNDYYFLWLSTKSFLRDRTYYNYQSTYEKHIQGTLGLEEITKITRSKVQLLYAKLASPNYNNVKSEEAGMSEASIANINQILYQIFDCAKHEGAIFLNPCENALKKMGSGAKGRKSKKVSRLTTGEEKALAKYFETSKFSKKWRPILSVLVDTGMRIGELAAISWECVDFDKNLIYINHSLAYGKTKAGKCDYMLFAPKTASGFRKIVMTDNVRKILSDMKEEYDKKGTKSKVVVNGIDNFVFLNRYGRPYYSRTVNLGIKNILKDYNKNSDKEDFVPIRNFTAHTLRHTFASKYYQKTKDWKALSLALGDCDMETCMEIYAEFEEEDYLKSFSEYKNNIETYI